MFPKQNPDDTDISADAIIQHAQQLPGVISSKFNLVILISIFGAAEAPVKCFDFLHLCSLTTHYSVVFNGSSGNNYQLNSECCAVINLNGSSKMFAGGLLFILHAMVTTTAKLNANVLKLLQIHQKKN